AVVVDEVLERISPVWDVADHGAHGHLRLTADAATGFAKAIGSVASGNAMKPSHADVERGELRSEIAANICRLTRIAQQELDRFLVAPAAIVEPHGRNSEAFLKDLRRSCVVAPR